MAESIMIQDRKECFLCGSTKYLHMHHCIYGRGRRDLSDKYGLTIYLCSRHHTDGEYAVHRNPQIDLMVKKQAQKCFEEKHSHEEYMELFGHNYLEENE